MKVVWAAIFQYLLMMDPALAPPLRSAAKINFCFLWLITHIRNYATCVSHSQGNYPEIHSLGEFSQHKECDPENISVILLKL